MGPRCASGSRWFGTRRDEVPETKESAGPALAGARAGRFLHPVFRSGSLAELHVDLDLDVRLHGDAQIAGRLDLVVLDVDLRLALHVIVAPRASHLVVELLIRGDAVQGELAGGARLDRLA